MYFFFMYLLINSKKIRQAIFAAFFFLKKKKKIIYILWKRTQLKPSHRMIIILNKSSEYLKIRLWLSRIFLWFLLAIEGSKWIQSDVCVAKATKIFNKLCPNYYPCCKRKCQTIKHWLKKIIIIIIIYKYAVTSILINIIKVIIGIMVLI